MSGDGEDVRPFVVSDPQTRDTRRAKFRGTGMAKAKVTVSLPIELSYPYGGMRMTCQADTVGTALDCVLAEYPHLQPHLFLDGRKLIVAVFVNGVNINQLGGLVASLEDNDDVRLVSPITGG